jgi:hypothetical protein
VQVPVLPVPVLPVRVPVLPVRVPVLPVRALPRRAVPVRPARGRRVLPARVR